MEESPVADFRYYHWQRWIRRVEHCRRTGEVFVSDDFVPEDGELARVIKFPLDRMVQVVDPEPPKPVA